MEEQAIIKQAKDGNRKALESLLTDSYSFVYGYLLTLSRDEELAKDITQEVMVKAIVNIHRFRGDSKFSTWLVSMAVNRYKDMVKKKAPALTGELVAESAETAAVKNETSQQLKSAIDKLPDKHRQAFLLKYFQGLTYEEIAQVLECPIGTVRSRLHHSLIKLREAMEGREMT